MKDFFILLLKINGAILVLLSIVILAQIWFEPIDGKDIFKKIWGSYLVIIVNFFVLSGVIKHVEKLTETNEKK